MSIETIDLSEKKFENYFRTFTQQDWTLCLGAGICKGILPDWFELTHNLVNDTFKKKWTRVEFKTVSDELGFSLDSWIQGCYNKLIDAKHSINDFYTLLEKHLYSRLLANAEKAKLKNEVIQMFESPKQIKKKKLYELCDFFDENYSKTTLMQIVNALLATDSNHKLPTSIITFNADSLLHSLLTIFNIKQQSDKKGHFHQPAEPFKKVTRTFHHFAESIPIFHLHGSLSPAGKKVKTDSRDLLIFLENSYIEIAGSMNSWAQTTFLYSAQNSKMVFLGLSMSDPNIRRWLTWTSDVLRKDLSTGVNFTGINLRHLWIRTKASSSDLQEFVDVSLRHMGVKIALIKNWNEVEKTLMKIM